MGIFGSLIGGIGGAFLAPFTGGASIPIGAGIGDEIENTRNAKKANEQKMSLYNQQMALAQQQFQFQQDYTKNRLQWQVEDAKKAGLHPMVAAGLSPISFSPVSTPSLPDMSSVASDLGQNLDYAVTKAKTQKQQAEALDYVRQSNELDLQSKHLDNELKQMEIMAMLSRLTNSGPAAPDAVGSGLGLIGGQQDAISGNPLAKPEPLFTFGLDGSGKKTRVYPTDFMTSSWEDRPLGSSITPLAEAEKLEQSAKFTGEIINNHVWSVARREFVEVNSRDGQRALAYWRRVGSVPRSQRALVKYPRERMNSLDRAFFDWVDRTFS